jgi:hypothetical protein
MMIEAGNGRELWIFSFGLSLGKVGSSHYTGAKKARAAPAAE